jgi:hypothetical protein
MRDFEQQWHLSQWIHSDMDSERMGAFFVLGESSFQKREFEKGQEAVERVLNNGRQVWSVDHNPSSFTPEDEIAMSADETFARLPDVRQYKLRQSMKETA